MKKLKLNSTLNHKCGSYSPYEISVEKVITLYGDSFEKMKNDTLRYDPYITESKELMCIDSDDVAHCLLFVDYELGDGLLVESEGADYARKSQFIPNARALVENNELTTSERKLHQELKQISDKIAERAHCGETSFTFDELLEESYLDVKSVLRDAVTAMLREREDIQMAECQPIEVPFQPDITVEAMPMQELKFYCPLKIVREPEEPDYDWDDEVIEDDFEKIPSECAVGCEDEINNFIKEYSEPKEEHRGLMVYFDDNPAISEKVFSAIPSVRELGGELMGVFECQVTETLTDTGLEELREYLTGQASDGWGEGLEQHEIKTGEFGEIYVSFWNSGSDWLLQTKEEFEMRQAEEMQPSMGM